MINSSFTSQLDFENLLKLKTQKFIKKVIRDYHPGPKSPISNRMKSIKTQTPNPPSVSN